MARKRCKATTKSGSRCRNSTVDGSVYCATHKRKPSSSAKSSKKRCEGITQSGSRCRNKAKAGLDYCATHAKGTPNRAPERCKGETQAGKRCRNRAVDGSVYCAVHRKTTSKSSSKSTSRSTSRSSKGRCTAITQAGKRCRNDAVDRLKVCGVHRPDAGTDDLLEELAKMVESVQGSQSKSKKKYEAPDFSVPGLLRLLMEFLAGGKSSRSPLDALFGIAEMLGGDDEPAAAAASRSTSIGSDDDGVSLVIPGISGISSDISPSAGVNLNLSASSRSSNTSSNPLTALWYLLNYINDNRGARINALREELAEVLERLDVRDLLP